MATETLPFRTELKQVLDIIVHSLYSHKDIFLRELISNASDAIDTLRFQGLTQTQLLEGDENWKIKIIPDAANNTLTVSDNGIGMSREAIVENLGTIAKSGTKALLESLRQADVQNRPELIGQFGVGFYSSFMVADKVTVVSRQAGLPKEQGVRWESDGLGEFTVEPVEKPTRGTDVILHLKEDAREFLQKNVIHELVREHSDFVAHPIVMDEEDADGKQTGKIVERQLNSSKAIWLRNKAEVAPEEYNEFYRHIAHDFQDPARVIHYTGEGTVEFRALLFVPAHKPFDLMRGDSNKGLRLYIRRVFIMDDCEALLPKYLRFIRGVVDSPDLPLNVSREMLQRSAPVEVIRKNLANRVLKSLDEMKREDYDAYVKVYDELGVFLKEGVIEERANREQIADLLLFQSTRTKAGEYTTLEKYVSAMPEDQKEIYFLAGENREVVENSPLLESLKVKGWEVLMFLEPIDEWLARSLGEYRGKKLKAVDRVVVEETAIGEETTKRFQPLLDLLKQKLPAVGSVRLSNRLKESAVCLVSEDWAVGAHMERVLQRMGRGKELPEAKRVLEVNPNHPTVDSMRKLLERNASDPRLDTYSMLLYDQAVLAEGSRLHDPLRFAKAINDLITKDAEKT